MRLHHLFAGVGGRSQGSPSLERLRALSPPSCFHPSRALGVTALHRQKCCYLRPAGWPTSSAAQFVQATQKPSNGYPMSRLDAFLLSCSIFSRTRGLAPTSASST